VVRQVDAAKEDDMCPHSWAWGPRKTAETMERNRLYNRDHPHRESPESRKKSNRKENARLRERDALREAELERVRAGPGELFRAPRANAAAAAR
jgi:hypothetical protein